MELLEHPPPIDLAVDAVTVAVIDGAAILGLVEIVARGDLDDDFVAGGANEKRGPAVIGFAACGAKRLARQEQDRKSVV